MKCLDEVDERWYCYRDDQLFYAKEQRWAENRPAPPGPSPITGTVVALITFLIVACLLVLSILFTLSPAGDCPACWPPSVGYPQLAILGVVLVADVIVVVLLARSLIGSSRHPQGSDM